jgi:hypothetical protein
MEEKENARENVPDASELTAFGLNIRGLITALIIFTICFMSILQLEVKEPLYTLGGMIVAFYFGHQAGSTPKK